ncbi:hypothetical protein G9A89_005838 [Geosiphon pyriformis]|nr:hypothetical protein G9A89_005838 [Geosiphon pyriformis]
MPSKTTNLRIKALPLNFLNVIEESDSIRVLSPSSIRPNTTLFILKITTLPPYPFKRSFKITVQQSNHLMQKSALFHELATQYAQLASFSLEAGFQKDEQRELTEESGGLPMLCIEAPVQRVEIIDAMLDWLSSSGDIKDTLTSSLASKVRSTQDFFSLIHFSTLLDLYEPFSTAVDEILVYYYFGLSSEERGLEIVYHDQFVEGILPGRFVRRLAESVGEQEAKEILASFFRGKSIPIDGNLNDQNGNEHWFEVHLDDKKRPDSGFFYPSSDESESNYSEEFTPISFPKHIRQSVVERLDSVPNTPFSPFDYAEPPTPLGTVYMTIPPTTPVTSNSQRILTRGSTNFQPEMFSKEIEGQIRSRPKSTPPALTLDSREASKKEIFKNSNFNTIHSVLRDTPVTASPTYNRSLPVNSIFQYIAGVSSNVLQSSALLSPTSQFITQYQTLVPPNTPATPLISTPVRENNELDLDSRSNNNPENLPTGETQSVQTPPTTPIIIINDMQSFTLGNFNDLPRDSHAFVRRELFEFAYNKMRSNHFM